MAPPPTAGSGRAARWPTGSGTGSGGRCTKPGAGSGCAASGSRPSARAPARPRRPGRPGGVQKGGLQAAVDAVKAAHPGAAVEVWAEDEHRLGLLPVVRRVWAPRGRRPTAWVRRRYRWLYVYGFVRPSTGQSWWCLLPTVSAEAFGLALAEFARDEGIG